MTRTRDAMRRSRDESGMSLVEVVVAMFIFAIVSSGVIYGMLSVITLSRDSRAREVAANLASQEIDLARDAANLFELLDSQKTTQLNGDTFHVDVATQWVTDPSSDIVCGAGGSALRYKRVNVEVTWENMRPGTQPVRSDTVIQPESKINDPTKGTILVSVLGAAGTGVAGVSVSAVPSAVPNGATTLPAAPAATDVQGCSYVLKVAPGNYDVTVSRSGYVDAAQGATSKLTVGVAAGASSAVAFQYDSAGTFTVNYASGYVPAPGEVVRVPADPATTFLSTYGAYVRDPGASTSRTRTVKLHPFSGGYQVFAGSCAAADPEAWLPGTNEVGQPISADRPAGVAAAPGGTATVGVPMGVVKLALGASASERFVRAVSTSSPAAGSGDPGCASTVTYSFGSATGYGVPLNGNVTIALPYGSWRLFTGTGTTVANWTTAVPPAQMSLPAAPLPQRTTVHPNGVVTFDPRVVTP
ncbi:type IV pilus modification PilV family protein [Cellulomonas sp. NPDC055163]